MLPKPGWLVWTHGVWFANKSWPASKKYSEPLRVGIQRVPAGNIAENQPLLRELQ